MSVSTVRSITVNQLGYKPDAAKIAIFKDNSNSFSVVNAITGEVIFLGEPEGPIEDKPSGKTLFRGEFTQLQTAGAYYIEQDGNHSATFVIDEMVYNELHKGLLKAFYFLRCGVDLEEEFAGPWKHKACHLSEGIVYGEPDRRLDCSGGWHDAGDYGKYTVAGAKAIADLLLAYELYPTAFSESIPLPESDGKIPDVLHECRYELEWLFKMQDKETGGVFHKLTTLYFPGLAVLPEDDLGDLYFSPISATSTATFAAIMAMASRIYRPLMPEFADQCLSRALVAWDWLEKNPNVPGFKNPPEISTGEYGDKQDIDERYWASAELYRTTGEARYHDAFKLFAKENFDKYLLGWADDGGYGTVTYLLNGRELSDISLYDELLEGLQKRAEQLLQQSKEDGYLISLKSENYIWGSNMVLMNNAMILLLAANFKENSEFVSSALEHVHYLTGRNVLDISYVSGFGDNPVMNLHYRPSVADDVVEPVPGFVSGGPNKNLQDDISKEKLTGKSPAEAFIDHIDSYATNEITIYWNSPAVFVLSHFVK